MNTINKTHQKILWFVVGFVSCFVLMATIGFYFEEAEGKEHEPSLKFEDFYYILPDSYLDQFDTYNLV